jgi:hypothetical protein
MADNMMASRLSVSGHNASQQHAQRMALQQKIQQKLDAKRMEERMKPPAPIKIPEAVMNAANKKLTNQTRHQVQAIAARVDKYYSHFGSTALSHRKRRQFTTQTTLEEAQEEEYAIQQELGASSAYDNCASTINWVVDGAEKVGPMIGMNLRNTSKVMKDKENQAVLDPEIRELSIKYESWFATGPELRLVNKIIFLLKQVHEANTALDLKRMNQPASNAVEKQMAAL